MSHRQSVVNSVQSIKFTFKIYFRLKKDGSNNRTTQVYSQINKA